MHYDKDSVLTRLPIREPHLRAHADGIVPKNRLAQWQTWAYTHASLIVRGSGEVFEPDRGRNAPIQGGVSHASQAFRCSFRDANGGNVTLQRPGWRSDHLCKAADHLDQW